MEELVDSILDYVRADYTDYAIMINGEWGSGKTYFWNNKVKNKIKSKNGKVICIAGGPEVTANPTNFGSFDYMIAGLGENSVPELIKQLINNQTDLEKQFYYHFLVVLQDVL